MIELIQANGLEYVGITTALLGIFYSIKQHKIAWIWNFMASCIYGILFYGVGLYSDMELQGVFMAMAIYGFVQWNRPDQLWEITKSNRLNMSEKSNNYQISQNNQYKLTTNNHYQ